MGATPLLFFAASLLPAQRLDLPPEPGSASNMVVRQFEASAPPLGTSFPAIAIYDAAGKPFHTSSLKGRYTVVVNGCLT